MDIILSSKTRDKVYAYQKKLSSGNVQPGRRLEALITRSAALAGCLGDDQGEINKKHLESLRVEDFIRLLYATKKPLLFLESFRDRDGLWTPEEIALLGDIGSFYPDTVAYSNGIPEGHSYSEEIAAVSYGPDQRMPVLYMPAPCTTQGRFEWPGLDIRRIATLKDGMDPKNPDSWELNEESYKAVMRDKLVAILAGINLAAEEGKYTAIARIPSLGCGAFSRGLSKGDRRKLPGLIGEVLGNLLIPGAFPFISEVVFVSEGGDSAPRYNEGRLVIRSSQIGEGAYFPAAPSAEHCLLGTGKSPEDKVVVLCVAADHASWPGNDAYKGRHDTLEGGTSMVTNVRETTLGLSDRLEADWRLPDCDDLSVHANFFPSRFLSQARVIEFNSTDAFCSSISDLIINPVQALKIGLGLAKNEAQQNCFFERVGKAWLQDILVDEDDLLSVLMLEGGSENKWTKLLESMDVVRLTSLLNSDRVSAELYQALLSSIASAVFSEDDSVYRLLEGLEGIKIDSSRIDLLVHLGRNRLTELMARVPMGDFSDYRQEILEAYKSIRASNEAVTLGGGCFTPTRTSKINDVNRLLRGEPKHFTNGLLHMLDRATRVDERRQRRFSRASSASVFYRNGELVEVEGFAVRRKAPVFGGGDSKE